MTNCKSPHDQHQRRCPRLGHLVHFGYCRSGSNDDNAPCFKVFDCWWDQFDVVSYFQTCLSQDKFNKLKSATPPNKVASLVELIQQARERTCKKGR